MKNNITLKDIVNPATIKIAESVFMAMAHEALIRETVEAYQRRILVDMGWPQYADNLFNTYHLPDEVFKEYDRRCKEERDKAGLAVDNPDFCPLLVAENLTMQAEHALIAAVEPVTGCNVNNLLCSGNGQGLENLKKYIDLLLKLLAPKVRGAKEILNIN